MPSHQWIPLGCQKFSRVGKVIHTCNRPWSSTHQGYAWDHGILTYKGCLVVGDSTDLRNQIMAAYHNSTVGGHSGIDKTTRRIKRTFYWKGLKRDVQHYISERTVCHCVRGSRVRMCILYNSSYHSSMKTTPFYAVYGHNPPDHNFMNLGSSTVAAVENWAKERPSILRMLKENLQQAQHRMKFYVDKLRSEREFEEGDWEYLRLQPYFLSPAEEYEVVSKILWAFSSALKGRKGCL